MMTPHLLAVQAMLRRIDVKVGDDLQSMHDDVLREMARRFPFYSEATLREIAEEAFAAVVLEEPSVTRKNSRRRRR